MAAATARRGALGAGAEIAVRSVSFELAGFESLQCEQQGMAACMAAIDADLVRQHLAALVGMTVTKTSSAATRRVAKRLAGDEI